MNTAVKAFLLILAVTIFIVIRIFTDCDCECNARKYVINEDYAGYIIKKGRDIRNHNTPYYILNDTTKVYPCNYAVFDTLQLNDSVIKHKGSLRHWLIHKGDTTLFYPQCSFYLEGIQDVTDEPYKSKLKPMGR